MEAARVGWVMIEWEGGLRIHEPLEPIKDEPRWPGGQGPDEMIELAIRGSYIQDANHPVIRGLNTTSREA